MQYSVREWAHPSIYAGAEPQGATEATYAIGIMVELAELTGKKIAGGAIDISKFFDQMPRQLLYMLARQAGMPQGVLDAYQRYQEALKMRNTVAGSVGKEYTKKVGIPQGDPLSMLFAALILRAWAGMMQKSHVSPYLYVDDMMLLVIGKEEREVLKKFEECLEETHQYLIDMGAQTAADKSHNFSNSAQIKEVLRSRRWHQLGQQIPMQDAFRYLGA